jgi:hypothetical protein
MREERTLSPQESLAVIADAIARTRENLRENSFWFLLWGWLIAGASFGYFILQQYTTFDYYFLPFPLLTASGIITSIVTYRKRTAQAVQGYGTYFVMRLWAVLGICFLTVVFINVSQHQVPFTYTLIMAGIGTLTSGWVLRFKPLVAGGVVFLVSAIASIYVPDAYTALLHGVAVLCGYLVPGYLLRNTQRNG